MPMTRRAVCLSATFGLVGSAAPPVLRSAFARRETIFERDDLATVFANTGTPGCFATFDGATDTFVLVDRLRAAKHFVPASTFKITNTLIALETGVVADEREVVPYGGKPQPFPVWAKDMTMAEAMPLSAVPIYQEIARRVGLERYRTWLDKLDYGNGETGAVVDRFWLDGPLQISAMEQAVFLDRLARRELPASRRAMDITASLIRLDARNGRTLYGKTGWQGSGRPSLGWWVGWVDRGSAGPIAFALNIDMAGDADAPKRLAIGKSIMTELGIW